jgi:hypothetical protein
VISGGSSAFLENSPEQKKPALPQGAGSDGGFLQNPPHLSISERLYQHRIFGDTVLNPLSTRAYSANRSDIKNICQEGMHGIIDMQYQLWSIPLITGSLHRAELPVILMFGAAGFPAGREEEKGEGCGTPRYYRDPMAI